MCVCGRSRVRECGGVEGEGEVGDEVVEGDERKKQSCVYIRNADKVSMHVCM